MRPLTPLWMLLLTLAALPGQEIANPVPLGNWVADDAGLLTGGDATRLHRILRRVHSTTDDQVVVVTTARVTRRTSPRDYAVRLFRAWGLGSASRNDGVMIFLSQQDRRIEIITGSGLKDRLPDAALASMLAAQVVPLLQRGATGEALVECVKATGAMLAGIDRTKRPRADWLWIAAVAFGLPGIAAAAYAYRLWWTPLRLPPVGRMEVPNEGREKVLAATWFARGRGEDMMSQLGFRLNGRKELHGFAPAVWTAATGLAVSAAAGAAWILNNWHFDLEPPMWGVWAVGGIAAALAPAVIFPPCRLEYRGMPGMAAAVGVITGFLMGAGAVHGFWSDFFITAIFVPATIVITGLIAAYALVPRSRRWSPEWFACEICRGELKPLEHADIPKALEEWQQKAQAAHVVCYRGWRCPKCHPTLAPGAAFLAEMIRTPEDICRKCRKPSKIGVEADGWRIVTCFLCGAQTKQKLVKPKKSAPAAANWEAGYGSGTSYQPSSPTPDNDTWQNNYDSDRYDPPASGGSTDGGGAGSSW